MPPCQVQSVSAALTSRLVTPDGPCPACLLCCCLLMLTLYLPLSSQRQSSGGQHTALRVQRGRVLVMLRLLQESPTRLRPVLGWGPLASQHRLGGLPAGELTHPTVHLLPHLQPVLSSSAWCTSLHHNGMTVHRATSTLRLE